MINAKKELLNKLILNNKYIIAAKLCYIDSVDEYQDVQINFNLKLNSSKEEYDKFLNSLDFEYDDGFGCQYIYGIVWLNNEEWLERWEYDGSEGWTLCKYPEIPKELK